MQTNDFLMLPIPVSMYTAVCALLGGASAGAIASAAPAGKDPVPVKLDTAAPSAQSGNGAAGEPSSTSTTATTAASPSNAEVDAGGHPWSEALHASTKTKTKDGYWRMKVGVSRPDNLPGFAKDATGAGSTGADASAGSSASAPNASGTAAAPAADDEDEFAAFRDALGNQDAAGAAATIPARKWSDADLGALCNQAAVKLGDPAPIKALIASYMPEGTVPHSRNIPEDKRAEFAAAVEAKADITFAG
jgi:hypothetical protein